MVCGFRQVIITGGEPLIHSRRESMLSMLAESRHSAASMNLVLRTNLAMPLDTSILRQIAAAVDQVVVSVDGNEYTHNARRGPGSYKSVLHNLVGYQAVVKDWPKIRTSPGKFHGNCLKGVCT